MQKDTILSQINLLKDPKSRRVLDQIRRVCDLPSPVLFCGETGTGKDVLVQYLYQASAYRRFVHLHCGDTPESLIESEWFGFKKGAFTGAHEDRPGKFDQIGRGILYLNQVDLLPRHIQKKLLRVVEGKRFFPLGSSIEHRLNARWIFSADQDLDNRIREGTFRKDLYYRISSLRIDVPPLRERPRDIESLFRHFARKHQVRILLSDRGWQWIREYPWPGNIREIENFIQNLKVSRNRAEDPDAFSLPRDIDTLLSRAAKEELSLRSLEKRYIQYLLDKYHNKARVARILNISRKTLYNKLRGYEQD